MTPERYQQIKQIFLAALELPEGEARDGHVLRACAGDAELEREVRSLLEHHADVSDPDHPASGSARADERPTEQSLPASSRGTHHSQATFSALDHHPVATPARVPTAQSPAPQAPSASRSSLRFDRGRFAPGSLIDGRYRIVDLIGRGGMGEVYRADDLKLGETVALKFLPKSLANNREWLDRFLEEVRVARNVSHPNVCRVYDVGEENAPLQVGGGGGGEHFITMEYVDGETLSSLTSRIGRLPQRKAEQLAQQLCAGLAAIHDLGILHRDLKPSNILIDDRGQLRVTDFGLAVPGEIKGFQAAAGTPGYVAPESLAGVEATVKSDIYQLGLLLYELFSGQPAYRSDGDKDLLKLQQTVDPPAPSTIAPDIKSQVEKVILQCLERDPALRPSTVRQVARLLPGGGGGDALAAALAAGQTPSPSMVAMAGRKGRMRPVSVLALVAVFIAFFVGSILLSKKAGLIQQAPLDRSGEALAERAREYLAQVGYPLKETDHEAWGFDLYEELLSEIERTDQSSQRWERLKRPRPTPIDFWYRRSPKHMGTQRPSGVITMDDPPMNLPAMIQVRLTPRGYLREIAVIDKEAYWVTERKVSDIPINPDYVGPPAPPVNFSPLFAAADLELSKFRAVQPERIPQVFADHRQAWIGFYPESPELQIKVEAAGLNGRVVAFRIGEVALPFAQLVYRPAQEQWKTISQYAGQVIFISTVIASGVFAWRNLRAKRGDLVGAGRAAVFVAIATLVSFLLSAHTLSTTNASLGNLRWMVAASLAAGALVWVMYLGLEPHVRRIWPESIISWTRLVQGRWYDPLVGSSVLIGAGVGCFALVMTYINRLLPGWLGLPPARPLVNETLGVTGLNGVRFAMGYVAQCSLQALQLGLMLMVACLISKIVLRRTAPALIVFGALQSLVWVLGSPVLNTWNWTVFAVSWPIVGLVCASGLIVLVRYGLIAVIVAGFVFTVLSSSPLTFDGRAWYAGISAVSIGLVLALPIYGAAVAMLGRTRTE